MPKLFWYVGTTRRDARDEHTTPNEHPHKKKRKKTEGKRRRMMKDDDDDDDARRRTSSHSSSSSSFSSPYPSHHNKVRDVGIDTVPSLPQRCVAAGTAACVSALVTNPLDVIKTRMQTTTTTTTTTTYSTNGMSNSSVGGIGKEGVGKPLTVQSCPPKCPTNANGVTNCVSTQCTTYDGNAWTVMRKVVRREGVSALWRGTKTALVMAGPAVGVYLPCYDFIRDYCVTHALVQNEDMAPLVAGAGARTIAVFAVAPLELMRTRQLAAQESGGSFMNTVSNSSGIQRRSLLFTGVSSTLIRDVPFSMMYWYSVEKLRSALAGQFSNENPKMDSLAAAFVSGNIAGAAISAVTTPVDVLKTRIQVDVAHSNKTGAGTGGRGGLLRELTSLVKHEGASSLFKGVVPRALRGGPTCGIVLVAYELVKSLDY